MVQPIWMAAMVACVPTPPLTIETPEPPDPTVLGDVGWLLQSAVDRVVTMRGDELQASYSAYMALAEGDCPDLVDTDQWSAECVTPGGVRFSGYAAEQTVANAIDSAWQLSGTAEVVADDGATLAIDGVAGWSRGQSGGIDYAVHYAYGTFLDGSVTGWMGEGLTAGFIVTATQLPYPDAPRALSVDGDIDGLRGRTGEAVAFSEVQVFGDDWPGAGCVEAPQGRASVQLPEGSWVDIDFGTGFASRCDGCGPASLGDIVLGEVCADFRGWVAWDQLP